MSRAELSDLVNGVQNIVSQRTPMPILSNILIEAGQNEITVTATDLTVGVRCTAQAKVLEPGSTTLPARRFAQLLREMNVSYIEMATDEKDVSQIIADSSSFRMNGMPRSDFPELPSLKGFEPVLVPQKDLKEALYQTSFAVSREDTRYMLTGVMVSVQDSKALFVGTDGKRLARAVLAVTCPDTTTFECIIPAKAVDEILKTLSDSDEPAALYFMRDKIAVQVSNRLVISKLLTGDFPDIDRIIPRQFSCVVPLHKEELSALLRQMSLFILETTQSARFSFTEGSLNLSANAADIGDGKVSMAIHYSGPRFDIAFHPGFFLDILKHSHGEYVYMGFQDAFNPAALSEKEFSKSLEELPSPLFVLMPMRLSEENS
jgi:DNA polymerase-3 subunit beta